MNVATHKKYGGSTIELTELCPGAARAREAIGFVPGGSAAERGTRIHALVEQIWNDANFISSDRDSLADRQELDCAVAVVEALRQVAAEYGFQSPDVRMELPVELTGISELAGGIIDHVAYRAFGDLFIADTKTGYKQISAIDNVQMLFYACCMWQNLDEFTRESLDRLHLIILQPDTAPPYDVAVRTWTIPASELVNYTARFAAAIERAETNPDLRIAGDHCEDLYCNARTTCPVRKEYLNERSMGAFNSLLQGIVPEKTRGETLAKQAEVVASIKKWCESVMEDLKTELIKDSYSVPGWQLIDSLGNRAWTNEAELDKAAKALKLKLDDYKPRELMTPPQFEKLLKSRKLTLELSDLTQRPYIGVKAVKSKDKLELADVFSGAVCRANCAAEQSGGFVCAAHGLRGSSETVKP